MTLLLLIFLYLLEDIHINLYVPDESLDSRAEARAVGTR